MKKVLKSFLLVSCLISSSSAGNWNAGLRASTLGIAAEVGYHFNQTFGLRFQGTWWEHFQKTLRYDGVTYRDVRFRPITFTLYGDWYFYTNWWRLTLGGGYNATKIRLNRDFSGDSDPEKRNFGYTHGRLRYKNHVSYYVGTGADFRKLRGSNWTFTMDAGIYFMSKVSAKVTANGPARDFPSAMEKLRRGAEELVNDKRYLRTYPAVSLGFKYEF